MDHDASSAELPAGFVLFSDAERELADEWAAAALGGWVAEPERRPERGREAILLYAPHADEPDLVLTPHEGGGVRLDSLVDGSAATVRASVREHLDALCPLPPAVWAALEKMVA